MGISGYVWDVCGCVWVCAGVPGCARVCTSARRCARLCVGVHGCSVGVCVCVHGCAGCAQLCAGVRRFAQEYACMCGEFLPENRVPTSADFNTYPIRIFYFWIPFYNIWDCNKILDLHSVELDLHSVDINSILIHTIQIFYTM